MRERLRIGDVIADPAANEIARGGRVAHVEPKVMDVLVLLAQRPGAVVARDALLAAAWPGSVVGDEALTQSVIKLRRALGDDPRAPRYIETIPKRGYRLIAPVVPDRDGAAAGSPANAIVVPTGVAPGPAAHAGVAAGPVARLLARPPAGAMILGIALVALVALAAGGPAGRIADLFRTHVDSPRNSEAEAYFTSGQQKLLVRGVPENAQARALFREAIEHDPTYARAYASLAMTYALQGRLGGADATRRALELAETARLMDPRAPDVHWTLGFVHVQARQHREAIAALTRALELDASFADAYALLGGVYTYVGEPQRAIPLLRTALRLNPDGGYLYFLLLGRAYLFRDDVDQALINLREAALRNPADVETHAYLAAALQAAGDAPGARWEREEVRALFPGFAIDEWLRTYPMTDEVQARRLAGLLGGAGL